MLYCFARTMFVLMFKYFCKWEVKGLDNLPLDGPVILIANHTSYWDPVVLASISERPVHFMAKSELFKIPIFGYVVKRLNAFPVDRKKSDRAAIRAATTVLNEGKVLGMFPEGTRIRTGELGEFKMGASLLATKTGAKIIPVALINTRNIFSKGLFRKFQVIIKEPYIIEQNKDKKVTSRRLQEVTQEIKAQIFASMQEFKDF